MTIWSWKFESSPGHHNKNSSIRSFFVMIKTPESSCHGTPVDKVYPHIKYMYKKSRRNKVPNGTKYISSKISSKSGNTPLIDRSSPTKRIRSRKRNNRQFPLLLIVGTCSGTVTIQQCHSVFAQLQKSPGMPQFIALAGLRNERLGQCTVIIIYAKTV